MKTLKGWLTGGTLAAILICGSTAARADGVIYGKSASEPCVSKDDGVIYGKSDGVIYGKNDGVIYGIAGVIYGIAGVIYGIKDAPDGCDYSKSGLLISD